MGCVLGWPLGCNGCVEIMSEKIACATACDLVIGSIVLGCNGNWWLIRWNIVVIGQVGYYGDR